MCIRDRAQLHALQGESPLILPSVDAQAVASVVADWTGIPVGRMVKNEIETVLSLADILNRRIIGQRHALDLIARRIQTSVSYTHLDVYKRQIQHFSLNPSRLAKDFTEALDRLPRGATSISDLSAHVDAAVKEGWVYSTLLFNDAQVRTGHLLVGMLSLIHI